MSNQVEPEQNIDPKPRSEGHTLEQRITDVMQSWSKLNSRYIGLPPLGPYSLPLEVTVNFTGPYSGSLVIRTTYEMPQGLMPTKPANDKTNEEFEVFQEFAGIFLCRLMTDLFGKEQSQIQKERPTYSSFLRWPEEDPAASCAYIVDGCPLEVRLWMKEAQD